MAVKGFLGTSKNTGKGYVKGYGKVWFYEQAITNILEFNNIKSKFRVTYERNNDGLC